MGLLAPRVMPQLTRPSAAALHTQATGQTRTPHPGSRTQPTVELPHPAFTALSPTELYLRPCSCAAGSPPRRPLVHELGTQQVLSAEGSAWRRRGWKQGEGVQEWALPLALPTLVLGDCHAHREAGLQDQGMEASGQ